VEIKILSVFQTPGDVMENEIVLMDLMRKTAAAIFVNPGNLL
jgi:hypothetical protein